MATTQENLHRELFPLDTPVQGIIPTKNGYDVFDKILNTARPATPEETERFIRVLRTPDSLT